MTFQAVYFFEEKRYIRQLKYKKGNGGVLNKIGKCN